MTITTKNGATFEADWVQDGKNYDGGEQLAMQLPGDTSLAAIVGDLVGATQIIVSKSESVRVVYDGYTLLSAMTYSRDRQALRVTLEKERAHERA